VTTFGIPAGLADLIDPAAQTEVLAGGFQFSEGPSWHPGRQELYFSDIPGDARWRWSEAAGLELMARPAYMGNGTALEPDGSLLVCEQVTSSLIRVRPDGLREVAAFHYEGKYLNSPNDVVVRSDASIYFTDPNYGRWDCWVGVGRKCDLDFQGVFRVPPGGGDLQLLVDPGEFSQPNGLAFSPDESILYVDDMNDLKAFDVAPDGSLSGGRVVQSGMGAAEHASGNPDGLKVDERGNIWCTARGGIWVVSPDGDLRGIITAPAACGNLVWGGPDLDQLYVMHTTEVLRLQAKVRAAPVPAHQLAGRQ
jgi:gluconolactonase